MEPVNYVCVHRRQNTLFHRKSSDIQMFQTVNRAARVGVGEKGGRGICGWSLTPHCLSHDPLVHADTRRRTLPHASAGPDGGGRAQWV